jgi:hypothetical protein
VPFDDLRKSLDLPKKKHAMDAAIADFNNDLLPDIFLVTGAGLESDIQQIDSNRVEALLNTQEGEIGFQLHSPGDVLIDFFPQISPITGLELSDISIGEGGHHPEAFPIQLSPANPDTWGIKSHIAGVDVGIYVGYDPKTGTWHVINSAYPSKVRVVVETSKPILSLDEIGFEPFESHEKDLLLMNRGGVFENTTEQAGFEAPTTCGSVAAGDFDNDMDTDIYAVCAEPGSNSPNILYENQGDGTFETVPRAGGAEGSGLGRGGTVSIADYDVDGFLDLYVTNGDNRYLADDGGPDQLYHNVGNSNHWLEVDLVGTVSNRDGIGARVLLTAGHVTQLREQGGGMHRNAQDFQRLHFGLGNNLAVDSLVVHWPSGVTQEVQDINADQVLQIIEPIASTKSGK